MLIQHAPNGMEKLELLGQAARYDLSCGTCGEGRKRARDAESWIYPAVLPDGRTQWMLKVLLSNACVYNCAYCANRAGRDEPKTTFEPEELAALFNSFWRRGMVAGFFLSSGIYANPKVVMDRMIATAEIVRKRYGFTGYLHLKLIPGAETAHIERAMMLAERVSVNLETVDDARLCRIAPRKRLENGLFDLLRQADRLWRENPRRWRCRGLTTQYVVGAGDETDRDFLAAMGRCYREVDLRRIYFSAFSPVEDTPLEGRTPTPLWREHRLYQADFLLRKYGFAAEELVLDERGNFEAHIDPKERWAEAHPERFPLEVNRAPLADLVRVPGVGPEGAKKIVAARRQGKILEPADLTRLGVRAKKASSFLTFDGKQRAASAQLALSFG